MSAFGIRSIPISGKKVIRDKRTVEQKRKDEKRGWVVNEAPELRRSVEQEIQGKVDTNHPDSCRASMTLAQKEEAIARDLEIARTQARVGEQIPTREAGSQHAVQAARLAQKLDGWTRAAISRRLAKRLVDVMT